MMRSSILGASTMLNVLIQHLPLQSLFWAKIWRAFRASDPSSGVIFSETREKMENFGIKYMTFREELDLL